jgi:hypothetical protein
MGHLPYPARSPLHPKVGSFTRRREGTCLARWLAEVNYSMWQYRVSSVTIGPSGLEETTQSLAIPVDLAAHVAEVRTG